MRKFLFVSTIMAAPAFGAELNVYTYDSFISEWGPGPQIEQGFEALCDCDLIFTAAGDGAAILSRIQLEGEASKADIVLGIDQNLAERAKETGIFKDAGFAPTEISGAGLVWDDPYFAPYDWGHFAFVYRKADIETPPASFDALAQSDLKIVIEDPRSSTPGLGLAVWVAEQYGEAAAEYWAALSDNVLTVTPGWSEAYAIFLSGEADMVLSYTTSPAYHKIAESDEGYAAAAFDQGHALQIELAGITANVTDEALAQSFLDYLATDEAQAIIHGANWMYPVKPIALIDGFDAPDQFKTMETKRDVESIETAKQAFQALSE